MGQVDLHFKPTVPVFDANVALGRRLQRQVRVDTVEGTLEAMRTAGVDKAVVYSTHAADIDARDGNSALLNDIRGNQSLVPQFACNPTFENLDSFAAEAADRGVRSVRMFPGPHSYPFKEWVLGPWLEWLESERLPLWIAAPDVSPPDLRDILCDHPGLNVVVCQVHYSDVAWAVPLMRSLPNLHVEISRFVVGDGIARLLKAAGHQRILFGSAFPDFPVAPQLYNLHRCGLGQSVLEAICAGNLERLLSES